MDVTYMKKRKSSQQMLSKSSQQITAICWCSQQMAVIKQSNKQVRLVSIVFKISGEEAIEHMYNNTQENWSE